MLSYIYFGTPELSKDVLEGLTQLYGAPCLIVTAPDKPKGRGLTLTPSPVSTFGHENTIPVVTPTKLIEIKEELQNTNADVGILFAYGKIIPQWLLDLFPHGIINVHPSLLPLYRGASPLTGPLLAGDTETGISIMDMDSELDHGDVYTVEKITLEEHTTRTDIEKEVVSIAPRLLTVTLQNLEAGTIEKQPQDHTRATYTKKQIKSDGEITQDDTDEMKYRKYRAYIGWPGIYFYTNDGVRIKITAAHMDNGIFIIDTVVPENKKEMSYSDFLN